MARKIETSEQKKEFEKMISRLFQSGNINFLFGSGASAPAIMVAGNIEANIAQHLEKGEDDKAAALTAELLAAVQTPTNIWLKQDAQLSKFEKSKTADASKVLSSYKDFLGNLEDLLIARKNSLLPKQANIFTTNYDLFLEKASEDFQGLVFNDGFTRSLNLKSQYELSSRTFFNAIYNKGNLYNYEVEVPVLNFIKVHGSLSWKKDKEKILFNCISRDLSEKATKEQIQEFNNLFSVVLPKREKFKETIMDRTYYDLLRIFANELDKESTLLIAFGFSFLDEHIKDITLRALKNPTLKLVIFAYNQTAVDSLSNIFNGYSNVEIFCPEGKTNIDFSAFNSVIHSILHPPPAKEEK